jgi:adenosyl cobinamide kinase/adenosyl cobinamide phosphate guanylyltransferase
MITLVLGGARSGKSAFAEGLAAASDPPVTYVATAEVRGDADMAERVRRHRERRPADWETAECGGRLVEWLRGPGGRTAGTVLIESLGAWVAAQPGFDVDPAALCVALRSVDADVVIVSEEVGMGVSPSTEVGNLFRDALGAVNQAVSVAAHRAFIVVAGRALQLGPPAARDS